MLLAVEPSSPEQICTVVSQLGPSSQLGQQKMEPLTGRPFPALGCLQVCCSWWKTSGWDVNVGCELPLLIRFDMLTCCFLAPYCHCWLKRVPGSSQPAQLASGCPPPRAEVLRLPRPEMGRPVSVQCVLRATGSKSRGAPARAQKQ